MKKTDMNTVNRVSNLDNIYGIFIDETSCHSFTLGWLFRGGGAVSFWTAFLYEKPKNAECSDNENDYYGWSSLENLIGILHKDIPATTKMLRASKSGIIDELLRFWFMRFTNYV